MISNTNIEFSKEIEKTNANIPHFGDISKRTENEFSEVGIEIGNKTHGQHKFKCPQCSESRKKKSDTPLSVNLDKGLYHCHHCGWNGSIKKNGLARWENNTDLSDKVVEWFSRRNISQETIKRMRITEKKGAICFNYFKEGDLISTKVRTFDKNFWVEPKGAPKIFYNIDGLKDQKQIYIVEGEIDALTMIQLGYTNTVSVPLGANLRTNNLSWVQTSDFESAEQIDILTDDDEAGNKLAEDLIKLLGTERTKRWVFSGYKDVNELYSKEGSLEKLTEKKIDFHYDEEPTKNYKEYIITEEPKEEAGLIFINEINVLSEGNILALTGPMKGRKTMLASVLVNQSQLRTAYIDTEQGRKHSWRTGKFTPLADVYHLRGEDKEEIKRVTNECVNSGEYQLLVLDNIRDMLGDFNNVQESGEIELYLKKVSEKIPTIAILHENKNSTKGQGHLGHGIAKIAQTTIRVQLVDMEDPSKGSFVECVHTRDEPFKRSFLSMDGNLSSDDLFKVGGKAMTQKDFFGMLGDIEYTRDEMNEKIAEIFCIKPSSAKNALTQIRKACPGAIQERMEGKRKIYYVSSMSK